MNKKKSQGEIFGIALMFVLIVLGLITYSQFKALDPKRDEDSFAQEEYKLLAQTTLNTIMQSSTSCEVERGKDSIKDLINYCLRNSFGGPDPQIECEQITVGACSHVEQKIEQTLQKLFTTTQNQNGDDIDPLIGEIPYEFSIELPQESSAPLNGLQITNLGSFQYKNNIITQTNLRDFGYQRAPSGTFTFSTNYYEIYIDLYLYYR